MMTPTPIEQLKREALASLQYHPDDIRAVSAGPCTDCGVADPFMYPCHQQGCPHQHPYPGYAPCPHCFESSGYVWQHGNDWESGPWAHQTNTPCRECNGTGMVEAEPITRDDLDKEGWR